MRRALLLPLLCLPPLCACGDGAPAGEPDPAQVPLVPPPFPLRAVVQPALTALDGAIGLRAAVPPADPERVRGLVATVAEGSSDFTELALEEVRELGDAAVPELGRLLAAPGTSDDERLAVVQLLGAADTPDALDLLLDTLEHGQEPWLRSQAAYALRDTDQDWIAPRLLLRLKYETDSETVLWIADRLARFANYTGLEGALVVWRTAPDDDARERAAGFLVAIAQEAGAPDAARLLEDWQAGLTSEPERSLRLERELWRWIGRLGEYQLRGVDDARFLLSRSGRRAAELLAEALHEDDVYVRVGAAQSLERMGPRGRPAVATLVEALGDPLLAPTAAAALGAIGSTEGFDLLSELARRGADPELRLAAARALGGFDATVQERAEAVLRPLLAAEQPLEIRQAAAESLTRLDVSDPPLALLAAFVTDDALAYETSERALRGWLARHAEEPGVAEALADWDALEPPPERAVPREERATIRARRRARIERLLAGP